MTKQATAMEAVEAIQAALDKGPTPGPWTAIYDDEILTGYGIDAGQGTAVVWLSYEIDEGCPRFEDAEFIAACNPENIRAVLASLAASQEEVSRLQEALKAWKSEAEYQYGQLRLQRNPEETDYPVDGALDAYAKGKYPALAALTTTQGEKE